MQLKDNEIQRIIEELIYLDITEIKLDCVDDKPNTQITNLETPLYLKKNLYDGMTLLINDKYYSKTKKEINDLISFIAKKTYNENLYIENSCFITDDLIDSLCKNKKLKKVSLDDNKYILTAEHYLKFKQANISVDTNGVEESLKENFDSIIEYNYSKKLISFYTYRDLQKINIVHINEPLTNEELENFKYLDSKVSIKINDRARVSLDNILLYLKKYNKTNKLILNFKDKLYIYNFLLNNSITNNIYIENGGLEFKLSEFLRFEKMLYDAVKPAIENNLSPFEKYIYAYNYSKKFKEYKENKNDSMSSRNLYKILDNEYMVCVGFSDLFGDLLTKMGIENIEMDLDVDVSYDKKEIMAVKRDGHSRRYVHIKDEKYDIDGFYISDPTWDNSLDKDYYSYLALTNNEILNSRRYLFIDFDTVDELFSVNDIDEYCDKIKFLLSRDEFSSLEDLIDELIVYIKELDINYYNSLKNKYSYIEDIYWPLDITDLIYDLGEYILSHVNKSISGETIINAIKEVYLNVYNISLEELDSKIDELISINKKRYCKVFPCRYKEFENGRTEVVYNIPNKFDIR